MIRHTFSYAATQTRVCSTYIHMYLLPAADTDIRAFTDTPRHSKFTGSHIHTHTFFNTSTCIHSLSQTHAEPSDIYISAQVFSYSCCLHTHNTMKQIQTHRLEILVGVTQPPLLCPELQASVLSGAHTHAKLAGRVTDWQAGHHPGQAGPSQEKGRKEPQPPSLG